MKSSLKSTLRYAGLALAFAAAPASAIPTLQFYAEGSTYNPVLQSWVLTGSPGDTVRIWAIGNLTGPGGKGDLTDVHMLISFNGTPAPFTLTGTRVGGTGSFAGFNDPSTPANASPTGPNTLFVGDDIPTLFPDANPALQNHQSGRLDGPGPRYFYDFDLGDFNVADSELTDFSGATNSPTADSCTGAGNECAQINAYEFTIPAGSISDWHFDLVGYSEGRRGPVFEVAPFSHDGDGTGAAPEPTSLLLLGIGLAAFGWTLRKRA